MSHRRAPLEPQHILETAIGMADVHGIQSLSMRKLASKLGVEAMSLYHHIKGKEELLDAMVDQVFGEIDLPLPGNEWREELTRRAHSVRRAMMRHRWALGLVESRAHPGPVTLRHHDAVVGTLRTAGFTVPQAAQAFALLDSFIYGFVLQELSVPFHSGSEAAQMARSILSWIPTDEYPHLVELAREHVLQPGYDFGDEFSRGLAFILGGLAQMRKGRASH